MDSLQEIDTENYDPKAYKAHLADCIVITHDGKLLMQKRTYGRRQGHVNFFGGHVEENESVMEGLVRELNEELGAEIDPKHVVFVGAVTENFTDHSEVVHVHVWRDENATITGCFECESIVFDTVSDALAHPKIMDYAAWGLRKCLESGASIEAARRHII